MAQAMTNTRHPLEPLSVDELEEAVAILRAGAPAAYWDDRRFRFVEVALREPPKAEVLAAEVSGNGCDLPRLARAVLIDRRRSRDGRGDRLPGRGSGDWPGISSSPGRPP